MDLPPLRPGLSGSAEASVRPASPADAAEIARVQLVTWRTAYRTVLPAAVLDDWDDAAATAAWRAAASSPPTPAHGVLVAEESGTLVGFTAFGPAELTEGEPPAIEGPTTEVGSLLVEPRWGRRGHGSRLLAALADIACVGGVARLQIWLPESDRVTAGFLASAGWARDGWARALDTGTTTIREIRWHTMLDGDPADPADQRGQP
ncbi:Acetyltransferase (GNAT) domain-containing protein [Modestobacter sp. DSM 44400]|uniref:GNAT family N-acetyltransferase n=1 Tax=Modestobacter sp. DSM 44400 TaxID=1550230 RepID=UPI0008968774|nr:GNAT family N-acetyltransferase [Modestobacter sp. DSM 44400]SDY72916.1 Acetyltransferase (GNAT) domain-containing protein [Modestobacter sp. DSM 44400]